MFSFFGPIERAKAKDTSFFESAILLFKVLVISPDSINFFAVFKATVFADFRNFLPKGLLTALLIISGDDLILPLQ